MTRGRTGLLVVAGMVFLIVGFVIGQIVQAAGVPGSAGDPLVSESYVEEAVGGKVTELQTQIDTLVSKVDSLQQQIEVLSKEATASVSTPAKKPVPTDQNTTTTKPVSTKTVKVIKSSANIRTGPGTSYNKVTTLLSGDTATYVSENVGWYKIRLKDGKEGWVAGWLVEVK